MASDQTKLCAISNNSGKDIVVAMVINDDETFSQDAVLSANQQMEILKTSAGNIIIKSGSSDTVTLDHNYKPGSDESGYVQGYNLVASESNWLYPLADLPVEQQGANGSASYAPQTVDATNQAAMTQAFDFCQTIAAYPSSQLTKDYMAALQQAQDAASTAADGSPDSAKAVADAIENSMDFFFKGTDQYKDVTLADVVAVHNYYNNFPFVWAQYKDSITYYLYGSDGTTATFAGTLSLDKPGAVDITKPNGGYTCSFAPAVNPSDTSSTGVNTSQAVNLSYNDGVFTDYVNASIPKIGLTGSFMLARLFTNNPDDNNVLAALSGTVNGIHCIGFDAPQPANKSVQTTGKIAMTSSPVEKYWNTLIHPKNQLDLIISLLTLVGAILVIPATAFAVYGIYRIVRYKQQVKEALTKDIVEYKLSELTQEQWERIGVKLGQYCGPNKDIFVVKNFDNVEGYNKVLQNDAKCCDLFDTFNTLLDCLKMARLYEEDLPKDTVQLIATAESSVVESLRTLATCNRTDLETILPKEYDNFLTARANVQRIDTTVHNKLTTEQKAVMDNNIIETKEIFDNIQNSTEKDKADDTKTNPDLEDKILPEELMV